tara:strand:+ start:121 stop:612 length:492 start_codon:yes stop_codon:yes gene_type:complete
MNEEPQKNHDVDCNVCGAPTGSIHHPSCPVPTGEDIFLVDGDLLNILTNAMGKASMDYMKTKKEAEDTRIATTRFNQMQQDYLDMGRFCRALFNVGLLIQAEDVVFFIENTDAFEPYYLIWMELNRPKEGDETWSMFKKEVWNRIVERKDNRGKQAKDTGNEV